MRISPLNPNFHTTNRERFMTAIGDEAISIIDTSDVLTRAGDFEYPFHPDSNFYYLTGIAEPECVLLLAPGQANPAMREMLFTSGTSDFVGTWEGDRLTPDEASKLSGIKSVHPLADLSFFLDRAFAKYQVVYMNSEQSLESRMSSPSLRRAHELRDRIPTLELRSALLQLASQRMIKDPIEIQRLSEAIKITQEGLTSAYSILKPGIREYELEAHLASQFTRRGSAHGFMPIIASGKNATTIHYMKNNSLVDKTSLVLFDVGAEVGWYPADISRTVPASGHFTTRSRAVYDAVLRLQKAAFVLLKPGCVRIEYENKIQELLREELLLLGFRNANPHAFQPHATSHFLGLGTHDVGDYSRPFEAGMVLTVEPGIYIKEERIGVRIEDDVLITETGCEVLSKNIPSDPDEVEELIQRGQI